MKCIYCKGEMKKGTTPFHIDKEGYHLMLDRVAAWICRQCGESYFEEQEVDYIQDLILSIEDKAKKFALSA
jgi:YgiT-type zinc finger domain-containing protein